jgi:hypothetical protein
LANVQIARRIALVCEKLGHTRPIICTPEELMGGIATMWEDSIVEVVASE